ncbi:hypothetical protein L804_03612 [Cryptococcus deuterogattii 2001/935-1]|nr:hypothetical protein L804_03612 [Cryptococcus deuterogattii 2001/935-1]
MPASPTTEEAGARDAQTRPATPPHHVPLETPGAGPSRLATPDPELDTAFERELALDPEDEEQDRKNFLRKRNDYIELEQSIKSSNELLHSLESYLSTFQTDLSAVSGQISELQQKSSDIEGQLKGRKASSIFIRDRDITLPPSLVLTLRDTLPSQNADIWLSAITQLDEKITAVKARSKVRAVKEVEPIIEGLTIKALHVLPPFLLSLIKPLKSASKGLSTNMGVLQTGVLLKYQPFYAFLLKQAPRLAKQVERGYVNAARAYYETGFRRYARALGQIRARTVEKNDLIGVVSSEAAAAVLSGTQEGMKQAYERLKFAEVDEGAVVLAYMVDDKELRLPVEALFRSLSLVLMDNASAEFTFIVRFFSRPSHRIAELKSFRSHESTPLDSPSPSSSADLPSEAAGQNQAARKRVGVNESNEWLKDAERIWHEVFDPALDYCTSFFHSMLDVPPPPIPLLTIIRLNDHLLATCDARGTLPLIPYLTGQKLAMWPIFRKEMDQHIESLKKLADDAEGKGLAGFIGKSVKDGAVRQVASRYAGLYTCVTALSEEADEAMLFSSMARLRAELVRLTHLQSLKIKSSAERHSFLSSIYEIVMHELVSGPGQTTHPRLQSELSFFRTREEEARRRISDAH